MPTYDTLLYEKQRHGVLITWNRPETLNAISRQMEHELSDALREAERDPEIRAIVMTGMGRAFSSGYDIGGERPDGKPFNPYNLTDAELEETKKLLIAQKKLLMTRYQDYDSLDRLMRQGAVWAAPEFSETYRHLTVLRKEGKLDFDLQHVLKPKEGGLGWVDTWMISADADSERVELAHNWVNELLQKENYVRVVRSTGYGGTVDVRDLLTADENELYFMNRSAEAAQLHMFDQPSSPEKWERIWSDVEAS